MTEYTTINAIMSRTSESKFEQNMLKTKSNNKEELIVFLNPMILAFQISLK